MSSANTHRDIPGRILAFFVFLLGIGLLCLVFSLAWSLFRAPVAGLELPVRAGQSAPPAAGIGVALTAFVRQVVLLALMTLAGSLVAGKGIQLYYSASHWPAAPDVSAKPDVSRNGRASAPSQEAIADVPSQKPTD